MKETKACQLFLFVPTGLSQPICKIIFAMALLLAYTPPPASAAVQSVTVTRPGPLQFGVEWVEQEGVQQ